MSAESSGQLICFSATIDQPYRDDPTTLLIKDSHPQQFVIRGSIIDGNIIIGFWAFKRARFPEFQWSISLVPPRAVEIDRTAQRRLVALAKRTVENFWQLTIYARPTLQLAPPPPVRRRTLKPLWLLLVATIGGKWLLRRCRQRIPPLVPHNN